ncbi:MAG: hypothetical protein IPL12_22750 [Bacteroidetes bacterium]|nr:hypothetical protein [Bacteroidota bacterium]
MKLPYPNLLLQTILPRSFGGEVIANSLCGGCHGGDFCGYRGFLRMQPVVFRRLILRQVVKQKLYRCRLAQVIRYGVKPDNHGVIIMPSKEMGMKGNANLAAHIWLR